MRAFRKYGNGVCGIKQVFLNIYSLGFDLKKKVRRVVEKNNTIQLKTPFFYRPTWVEIDHSRLKNNFQKIKNLLSPQTSILCVVKANAYGHGLVDVAKTLEQCQAKFFGITSLEEALQLKQAGVHTPSLILGNSFPFTSLEEAIRNKVRVTIASIQAAEVCDSYAKKMNQKVYAHAKIDTGMSRIGIHVQNGLQLVQKIKSYSTLELEGIYTHFSDSAEDPEFTQKQLHLFENLISQIKLKNISIPYIHCSNSAGIYKYSDSHFTLVRPGLSLYGVTSASSMDSMKLKPVLSWKSRIVFLKHVPAQTSISYAGTFITKRKSRIATAAFGYADGFRRSFSNQAYVLVRGQRVPVLGRVTMDMTMLDVTDIPSVDIGDEVVLIGEQGKSKIHVKELAGWDKTSPYEIFCGISLRVPRLHIHQ